MKRLAALFFAITTPALANQSIPDQYPDSLLYSAPVEVIPNVWSAIGQTSAMTYENAGHNNNLSFIVTGEGVVVVNAGASYKLAEALHDEIKQITDEPVVLVINENGQGHAMLGNSYWAKLDVPILAHDDADVDFSRHGYNHLAKAKKRLKDRAEGTEVVPPTETFDEKKNYKMGKFTIRVRRVGPAHAPGDIQVWLPKQRLVIAGDIAVHERLPEILETSHSSRWVETFDEGFEQFKALYVIPGHGHPTNMAQVRRYTREYLAYLRGKVREVIKAGDGLAEAYYVDQSPYKRLDKFKDLATRNAGQVFQHMEWE